MNTELVTDVHHDTNATDVFGFWMYILSDCILFATLFATYLVLAHPGSVAPSLKSYIRLPYVLAETAALLISNFVFGLAVLSFYRHKLRQTQIWLILSFLLGIVFVGMELNEFVDMSREGFNWSTNAAASAFFTLVGTHGLHVSIGLLWILIMLVQLSIFKIGRVTERRITYLGLFWNFLDIVWIFLFTIVYLMGAMSYA